MSLSPILGAASQALSLFSNLSSSSSTTQSPITDPRGGVDLSQAAQFFSKLQTLAQTDATKFKQLTAQISSQLQAAAQNATGSEQTFLTNLSNQFSTASQTGSASALQPPQSTGHHGHHHHAYNQSSQTAGSSSGSGGVPESILQLL